MFNIDVGGDVLSAIIFLLLVITVVQIYIAHLLSRGIGSERIIEKHVIHGKHGEVNVSSDEDGMTEEERKIKIKEDIKMEEKWNKNKVESKANGVGTEKIVDGKGSLAAVEKLRNMQNINNKSKNG